MSLWALLGVAVLLSLERICYVWIWRAPEALRAWCDRPAVVYVGAPVDVVQKLFYGFKVIQGTVFVGWCYVYGHGSRWPLSGSVWSLGLGGALLVVGQLLNVSVFYRLGRVGVFYGDKLGYEMPWCRAFPFSSHVQGGVALLGLFCWVVGEAYHTRSIPRASQTRKWCSWSP